MWGRSLHSLPEQFLIPKLNSPVTASLSAYHREAAGIGSGEAPSYSHEIFLGLLPPPLLATPCPQHMNRDMKSKDGVEKTEHERRIESRLSPNLLADFMEMEQKRCDGTRKFKHIQSWEEEESFPRAVFAARRSLYLCTAEGKSRRKGKHEQI